MIDIFCVKLCEILSDLCLGDLAILEMTYSIK